MGLTPPMWMGLNSPKKVQIKAFVEYSVVRRAVNGLVRQAVESKHRGGRHFPPKRFGSAGFIQHSPGHIYDRALISFAKLVLLRNVGRQQLLDDHRVLAVVVVVVGDEFTDTIGTQV